MTVAPLDGVRGLDASRPLPGGYATLLLVERGADVVTVEQPGRAVPPYTAGGRSVPQARLDRGERAVARNVSTADGVAAFREPTAPVRSASPARALAAVSGLGEHTAAVLAGPGRALAARPEPP